MGESAQPSLQEIFDAMTQAVEMDGSLKKRFNALVHFNVDGETVSLDVRSNSDGDTPDLVVKTSLPVLLDLINKKVKPQQAFMKGKLKIRGKMPLAMKLTLVLEATRKNLALQNSRL
eukprot:scaffold3731_cov156-Amphora_coffeaeformis.AAC.4